MAKENPFTISFRTSEFDLTEPANHVEDRNDEALMRETLADCLQGQEVSAEGLTPKTAENTLRFLIAEGWPITDEMIGNVHFDRWMGPIDYDGVIEQRDQMLEFQKERVEKAGIELDL